ncbi:hypothetical protein BGZ76_011028 [Entomortierella beljakovae]|nr:hypothetical protein BGZ76_011028 [Entomortierella beljakovae]
MKGDQWIHKRKTWLKKKHSTRFINYYSSLSRPKLAAKPNALTGSDGISISQVKYNSQVKPDNQATSNDQTKSNGQAEPIGKTKPGQIRASFFIRTYDFRDENLTLKDVEKVYGVRKLYKDEASDDCMDIEKRLSKLESSAAVFINKTRPESKELFLTRAKLADSKKFLATMSYRSVKRKIQYDKVVFDVSTR